VFECICGRAHHRNQKTGWHSDWIKRLSYEAYCSKCQGWSTNFIKYNDDILSTGGKCKNCMATGIQPISLKEFYNTDDVKYYYGEKNK